jgi:hypothetical protein
LDDILSDSRTFYLPDQQRFVIGAILDAHPDLSMPPGSFRNPHQPAAQSIIGLLYRRLAGRIGWDEVADGIGHVLDFDTLWSR